MDDLNPYLPPKSNISIAEEITEKALSGSKKLNPWISMWTKPRATMQQIVETNPRQMVLLLMAIVGISEILNKAVMKSMGDIYSLSSIFLAAFLLGPIIGLIGLYWGGALLTMTGRWLGGQASPVNVRSAIAWSSIPSIWILLLWMPEMALFGGEMFTLETPVIDASQGLTVALIVVGVFEAIILVWASVVFMHCLAQVQNFSAWRAFASSIIAFLFMAIFFMCVFFMGFYFSTGF